MLGGVLNRQYAKTPPITTLKFHLEGKKEKKRKKLWNCTSRLVDSMAYAIFAASSGPACVKPHEMALFLLRHGARVGSSRSGAITGVTCGPKAKIVTQKILCVVTNIVSLCSHPTLTG